MTHYGRFPALIALALLGLISISSIGCSSDPELTLTSLDHSKTFKQGFTQAYTSRDKNGDVDVVLVDQATEDAMRGVSCTAPVRQVMHIRIVWSPTREMKAVVSNACVKWYVIGRQQPQDVLQYSGIAFVAMKDDDDTMTLKVNNALLKPSAAHGNLVDPVGSSRLEGSFVAHQDTDRVQRVLSALKVAVAAATPAPIASSAVEQRQ